jgi:two-component system, cell cycle sensor histidine kinase and response regulator CckA
MMTNADTTSTDLPSSLEQYESIVNNAVEGIFQSTPEGRYLLVNPALARMYGYNTPAELIESVDDISHSIYLDASVRIEFQRLMETNGQVRGLQYQVRRRDGHIIWISEHARAVRDATGKVMYYEGFIEDITERKRIEQQLHQSQKMEAVGRLAGGIAHDFNNILTAILGYSELLQLRATDDDTRQRADDIRKSTERAAALCRQLLTFSRSQILEPKTLDLNAVVLDMEKMLLRLISEDINLVASPGHSLPPIKADLGQIEQVILNLAVNARDAMRNGGTLTIETTTVHIDEKTVARNPELASGDYAMLAVSDTGCGIPSDVMARLFEPFFTTKPAGKGTGLGLATCYGIVKQAGGHITVYSEENRGTTFRVYLPAVREQCEAVESAKGNTSPTTGHETILLAEDEPAVRELSAMSLRELGYEVIEAADGSEAMRLAKTRGCRQIDLLVTDVVMPEMGGKELAYWLRTVSPKTRVLFTSGYTDRSIIRTGALNPGTRFLQKPYPLSALASEVRGTLDG